MDRAQVQEALFAAIGHEAERIKEGKTSIPGPAQAAALLGLAQAYAYVVNPDTK